MKCYRVKRYIEHYLAYKRGRSKRVSLPFDPLEFEAHLASCGACRELYHEWEHLDRALEAPAEAEPPWNLTAAVMERISSSEACSATHRLLDLALAGVAVAAFVGVLDLALGACAPDFKLWILGSGKASAAGLALRTAESTRWIGQAGAFLPRLFAEAVGLVMRISQFLGGGV